MEVLHRRTDQDGATCHPGQLNTCNNLTVIQSHAQRETYVISVLLV
jgi:hypothetical protein